MLSNSLRCRGAGRRPPGISRNVQQAAHGTQQVSASIAEVSIAAGRSGTIAFEVLETVRLLSTHAEALNGDVGSWRISAAAEWWQEPLAIIAPCQQLTFKDILP